MAQVTSPVAQDWLAGAALPLSTTSVMV